MNQDRSLPTPGRPSTAAQRPRLQPKKRPVSYAPRNSAILRRRMHTTGPDENDGYGDDRAIRQFLDEIPVVPKLPQMPDVRKYAGKGKTTGANRNNKAGDRMSIIKNYMLVCILSRSRISLIRGRLFPCQIVKYFYFHFTPIRSHIIIVIKTHFFL